MQKRTERGIIALTAIFFLLFTILACNYYRIAFSQEYVSAAQERSEVTISAGEIEGTIYDRNMKPIVNAETVTKAVIVPSAVECQKAEKFAVDKSEFREAYAKGEPFVFECTENTPESDGLTVFEIPERYSETQLASHIVGYISDGSGMDGLEYAYDSVLRGDTAENSVTYNVDGFGHDR